MNIEIKHWTNELVQALFKWRVFFYMGLQDVKSRYQRTKLGLLWPFFTIFVWVVGVGAIYGNLFGQDLGTFLPYLSIGFLVWGFIQGAIVEGCNAYVGSVGYIKQFNFPSLTYVFRSLVATSVNFLITSPILIFIVFYFNLEFGFGAFYSILGLVTLLLITFFHILFFSTLTLYIRDTPYLMSALLQLMFFVTPIIFTVDMLRERGLDFIYKYNPFYYLIEIIRFPLLNNKAPSFYDYKVVFAYLIVLACSSIIFSAITKRTMVYKL